MKSRFYNAKRNILAAFVNKIISILLPFLIRTIFIQKIGIECLGLNSLFSSILSVLNLAELGFSTAVVYSLYKPIELGDLHTICALMNYYKHVYRKIGAFILIAGMAMMPFLPMLINGDIPDNINIYFLYMIYLFDSGISYLLFAYKQALPTAKQRTDIVTNVNSIVNIIASIAKLIILYIIPNYYLYVLIYPIATILSNLILSYNVDRAYPECKAAGEISKIDRADIRKRISGLMIGKVCGVSRNAFDSIFVSAFLGLTETAMYNNYYLIISALTGLMLLLVTSITPSAGSSVVSETTKKNYQDMRRMNFLYMFFAGWCSVCLLCLYQPFMKVWVGEQYLFNYLSVFFFSLYFYVLKMGDIIGIYVDAAGIWWENRYRALLETVANILLNYILGKAFGIVGIIGATIISLYLFNHLYGASIDFRCYFKNGKKFQFYGDHLKYFGVTMVVAVMTIFICHFIHTSDILQFVLRMIICITVTPVLYLMIYRHTYIFKQSMAWFLENNGQIGKKFMFLIPKD